MTQDEVRTLIDGWLVGVLEEIAKRQTIYKAKTGTYFNPSITHSVAPEQGGEELVLRSPDNLIDFNRVFNWQDFYPELASSALPCRLYMDDYSYQSQLGYIVRAEFEYHGKLNVRVISFGPDASQEKPWHVL